MRYLEHTADTALEVQASTLEACFARAAAGMLSVFVPALVTAVAPQEVTLDVTGADRLDLLVAWLEEVLFQSEIKGLAVQEVAVTRLRLRRVLGWARGVEFGPKVNPVGPVVKGVSRYDLQLRREGASWRARVVLDV